MRHFLCWLGWHTGWTPLDWEHTFISHRYCKYCGVRQAYYLATWVHDGYEKTGR